MRNGSCVPGISIAALPSYPPGELHGSTTCAAPADNSVAVFIFVEGWWTKPTWAAALTAINADGTWTANVWTAPTDENATRYAAFLVRNGYTPPRMAGDPVLPSQLYDAALANALLTRTLPVRQLQFSSQTWNVKASTSPVGPGPCLFSDRQDDVWVDGQGLLHLSIHQRDGLWHCTEIINQQSLGYGRYIFRVAGAVDQLDQNAVLGLFTWDSLAPAYGYREIDIEFSRWGIPGNQDGQYVIRPWDRSGLISRFNTIGPDTAHCFDWQPGSLTFYSYRGDACPGAAGDRLATWTYSGADVPPAGGENARLNLWLMNGLAPVAGQPIEMVVKSFQFIPLNDARGGF
jgi:hypothetical protein